MTLVSEQPTAAAAPLRDRSRRRVRAKFPWTALVIAVGFVLGIGVLLYPSAAGWFTQYVQSQRIGDYSDAVRDLGEETRHDAIQDALAYNAELLDGTSVLAANANKPASEAAQGATSYGELLAADTDGLMARIKIPAIDADLPIYHGTSDDVLGRGVGHVEGTALPVGGDSIHSVLTGHRGLASAELFTRLDEVEIGDTFTIEVFGEVLTYQVNDKKVVEPTETETLYPQRGEDLVTLVTCTPLGINSHRILVTGERILPTPIADLEAAGETPDIPGFPWWAVGFGAAVVASGAYVWLLARPRRESASPSAPDASATGRGQ